ncbi:MAG TPA: hypothetical protein DCL41_06485 [Bdellovibrionales bacterium]|nr:hypothetical protein [Pseudobdellovibrionaceae bacterium]HAG91498.1 hypothetical protein [Bdellovibrionales bacterium]|tara:strand:- start:736 stop:957 length:222 start_codon:yes stop_codon:yes gene_type:complete
MQISPKYLIQQLAEYGLNPKDWLIKLMTITNDGLVLTFESLNDKELQLRGFLENSKSKSLKLKTLELVADSYL